MGENRDYLTHEDEQGCIKISEEVLTAIAFKAINEIEGVSVMGQSMTDQLTEQFTGKKQTRGVRLEIKEDGIVFDVYLLMRYGQAIPETAVKVQEGISSAIASMAGFTVKTVNVHVGGISFA